MPFGEARAAAIDAYTRGESYRQLSQLTPFERHRRLVAEHARLYGHGAPAAAGAQVVTSDEDALRSAHRFLRSSDDDNDTSWESRLAAKYYSRLFKEYAIADLSRWREKQLGLRWRTEREVVSGKGQFTCGAKGCDATDGLASYEVPFAYTEDGVSKQALVKLRVCASCGAKLNHGRGAGAKHGKAASGRAHKRKRGRGEPTPEDQEACLEELLA